VRLIGLTVVIAPLASSAPSSGSLGARLHSRTRGREPDLSHVHVLLSSAGLALLEVAGVAGALRSAPPTIRVEASRRSSYRSLLEALDR
jgi:hypothetical protein